MTLRLPEPLQRLTTDPDAPLQQGVYRSALRDERLAAILGAALGILFSVCFVTGLYSHIQQNPVGWLPIPPRPAGLYRITQGLHVAAGIASVPVLVAKLWLVWPRFVSFPVARSVTGLVERIGLLPLVAGGIFMTFSGVANIAQWYPWRFSFTASHYWMSWVTMGAIVAHGGAKWAVARRSLARPSRRPALAEADPELGTSAEEPAGVGLSRRGLLATVAGASGLLTLTTIGQTVSPLRRLGLLAPRDPATGPQGRPVNRGAANAGVVELAQSPGYRLEVSGRVARPLTLTLDQLRALPTHGTVLPIACVEGWSFSAPWSGVRIRDLLEMAGAEADRTILIESLEPRGAYRTSTLNAGQAADRDTMLALNLDGETLALDHGFPCRLIAPNRPGVLQTKWVNRVVVL